MKFFFPPVSLSSPFNSTVISIAFENNMGFVVKKTLFISHIFAVELLKSCGILKRRTFQKREENREKKRK